MDPVTGPAARWHRVAGSLRSNAAGFGDCRMGDRGVFLVQRLHDFLTETEDLLFRFLERGAGHHAEAQREIVDAELLVVPLEAFTALFGCADNDVFTRRLRP